MVFFIFLNPSTQCTLTVNQVWNSIYKIGFNKKKQKSRKWDWRAMNGKTSLSFLRLPFLPLVVSRSANDRPNCPFKICSLRITVFYRMLIVSGRYYYQTNVSFLRILNLQSGQVAFIRSHLLMHPQWKWWLHGRVQSSAPSTYRERQMQHSCENNAYDENSFCRSSNVTSLQWFKKKRIQALQKSVTSEEE